MALKVKDFGYWLLAVAIIAVLYFAPDPDPEFGDSP